MDNTTRLLVLAVEDVTGIWQAVLDLPHEASSEEAARQALGWLAADGLIEFFVGPWPPLPDARPLTPPEVANVLSPGPHWSVPSPGEAGPFVYFAATDAGEARIRELRWGQGP